MTPGQQRTVRWLVDGEVGESSKTMAVYIAFGVRPKRPRHPLDPADFDRCLRYLQMVPEARPGIHRMADVSPEWAALAKRWDEIEASHLDEVGLGWWKARSAPRTYDLMKSVLESAETQEPKP